MKVWQVDFYRRQSPNPQEQIVWELIICQPEGELVFEAQCLQSQANSAWLIEQLQRAASGKLPTKLQVFRPQSLNLVTLAGEKLGIEVEATRHTIPLKQELLQRNNSIEVEQNPPQALPDQLWGDKWSFVTFPAGSLEEIFGDRPIPIRSLPTSLLPINLGIASTVKVPGVVIYGGRKSMQIASWLQGVKPAALNYIPTEVDKSGGLILAGGLVDRWIVATFEDEEVARAAKIYEERKQASQGLHFLLIQPDDSGITTSGFWLLI
ncbi:MAG: Tab2/Atab2 family RNA-binding protein [Spirulinaceae cyanobacterium]